MNNKDAASSPSCFANPFDESTRLAQLCPCGCGQPKGSHAPGKPDSHDSDAIISRTVESAVVRSLFHGDDHSRRIFMKIMGTTAAASLISAFFPLDAAKALAAEKPGSIEKKDAKIGFIPITCGTPIIMAHPMGFYAKYGITDAVVQKASGWAMIRDWAASGQTDYAHMLAPMPFAIELGLGSSKMPFMVPAIENINGQAITLRLDHTGVKEARDMKGFVFAVPFDYSMHNLLLRYYLAEGGVNPDTDVQIRVLPPSEMVANLKAGNLDGYLSPDPFNQRAVYEKAGFIFKLTRDIWPGHPCCVFTSSEKFAKEAPNTFSAVVHAIIDATLFSSDPANRKDIAKAIAPRNYLNQPVEVIEQVLTGKFPDGLGNTLDVPERIDFDPFPWHSMGVWILTQLKRWGYLKGEVNYKDIAEKIFRAGDCAKIMQEMGKVPPASSYKTHTIMGKTFDSDKADEYLKSFAIYKKS